MKKIALITKNKILAQGIDAAIKAMPDLEFELFLLLNSHQALLDAEIFEIDVALIDVMDCNAEVKGAQMSFMRTSQIAIFCCSFRKMIMNAVKWQLKQRKRKSLKILCFMMLHLNIYLLSFQHYNKFNK